MREREEGERERAREIVGEITSLGSMEKIYVHTRDAYDIDETYGILIHRIPSVTDQSEGRGNVFR